MHSTVPTFLVRPPELMRWAAYKEMFWLPGEGGETGHRIHSENNSLWGQVGRNGFGASLPRRTEWPFRWGPTKPHHSRQQQKSPDAGPWGSGVGSALPGPRPHLLCKSEFPHQSPSASKKVCSWSRYSFFKVSLSKLPRSGLGSSDQPNKKLLELQRHLCLFCFIRRLL